MEQLADLAKVSAHGQRNGAPCFGPLLSLTFSFQTSFLPVCFPHSAHTSASILISGVRNGAETYRSGAETHRSASGRSPMHAESKPKEARDEMWTLGLSPSFSLTHAHLNALTNPQLHSFTFVLFHFR